MKKQTRQKKKNAKDKELPGMFLDCSKENGYLEDKHDNIKVYGKLINKVVSAGFSEEDMDGIGSQKRPLDYIDDSKRRAKERRSETWVVFIIQL
eukprot:jgi/Psemu1/16296/gm1.16296_g